MSEQRSASVTLKGSPITLAGKEVKPGDAAPDFTAIDTNLQPVRLSDARGKVIVLSSVPSVDTPVCDTETRRFNTEASALGEDIEVWTISMDLPFAQKRWCGAVGVDRMRMMSDFRERSFSKGYGVEIMDGPVAGVTTRAVFVIGRDGTVRHVEYVKDIANEPDYEAALNAAKEAARG